MHISFMIGIGLWALWLRWRWQPSEQSWSQRWQRAMLAFTLPPLLLLSAALAVLWMGHHGNMLGLAVGPMGCWLSLGILLAAIGTLGYEAGRGVRSHLILSSHPQKTLYNGDLAHCLPLDLPFAARFGFLRSRLIVSQGLLTQLTPIELDAVLAHENAHQVYRDTFWFFWLGWLRQLTGWLPNTAALWQELLLLREVRADLWAAQQVEPLLLAEILVKLVAFPANPSLTNQVAFNQNTVSRLEQRVEALLSATNRQESPWRVSLGWGVLPLMPLITVLLHTRL